MKLTQSQLRILILKEISHSQMVGPEGGGGGKLDPYINIDAFDKDGNGFLDAEESRARQDAINKKQLVKDKVYDKSKEDPASRKKLLQALEIISIFDPTGLSGWPLLGEAMRDHEKNPTTKNKYKVYMSAIGVIPVLGKSKFLIKLISSIRNLGKPSKATLQTIKKLGSEYSKQAGKLSDLVKPADIQSLSKNKEVIDNLKKANIDPDKFFKTIKDLIELDKKIDIHTVFRKALFYLNNAIEYAIDKAIDTKIFDDMVDFGVKIAKKGYEEALSSLIKEEKNILINKKIIEQIIRESIEDRHNPNSLKLHDAKVGNIPIKIQICDELEDRKKGLMFRHSMPRDEGMLFIHDAPVKASYYMKNTYIPLTIAFADEDGVIFQMEDMSPGDLTSKVSIQPALYALEMNKGWFDRNGIVIGDNIDF